MSLEAVREAIDSCPELETAVFARRARNAIARAILEEALTHAEVPPPERLPPLPELERCVGDELGLMLAAVYVGGDDWTTYAIDALEPLHALARA